MSRNGFKNTGWALNTVCHRNSKLVSLLVSEKLSLTYSWLLLNFHMGIPKSLHSRQHETMTRSLPGSQVKKIKVLREVCPLYWAQVTTVAGCGPSWMLSFLVSEKHLSIMYSKGPGWSSCKRKKMHTTERMFNVFFFFLPTSVFLRFTSWVSGLCPLSQGSQIMSRWKSLSSLKKK